MYNKLKEHLGHNIECASYGKDLENISIECTDCNEVLVSHDKEPEDNEEIKMMIAVEYYTDETKKENEHANATFEIFDNVEKAHAFAREKYKINMLESVWTADFNMKYIFIEDEAWNYDDNADLYSNKIIIYNLNAFKKC